MQNTSTPLCVVGDWNPYPSPPPSTITENITYPFSTSHPSWEIGLKIFSSVVAMFMAIVGNVLVILTVLLNKRLYSSTNFYLLNLAISDFFIGALNMWMHLLDGTTLYNWPFGEPLCKLYPFLQMLWLTGSALFMTVIACERYVVIVHPLRARLSKPYQHLLVMVIVWSVAVLVALPNVFVRRTQELLWSNYHQVWCDEVWSRRVTGEDSNGTSCLYEYPYRQAYYTTTVVVTYFVPILFMTLCYLRIVRELSARKLPGEQVEKILENHQKTNQQVIRMLIIVLFVFCICWTPQEIFVFIDANWQHVTSNASLDVRYALIYIAYFNSSLNPLLYAGFNRTLRAAFTDMIKCRTKPASLNKITPSNGQARTSNGHTHISNGHAQTMSSTF